MIHKHNKIIIDNRIELFIKLILMLSTPFLTILLSNRFEGKYILIGAVLSFFIFIYIIIRKIKIEKVDIKKILLITYISLYVIKVLLTFSGNNIALLNICFDRVLNLNLSFTCLQKILGFMSIPSTIFFIYLFVEKAFIYIDKFKKSLTKIEKRYLIIIGIISIIVSILLTINTTAFSKPYHNNSLEIYDVLYTSDTGALMYYNTYFNVSYVENDIRQPLFGIFALPFAVIAKMIGDICFFLPENFSYEIIFTIIQFLLTTISTIMIGKMMELKEEDKKYLYLLFSCSFPYILFNIILEQYVIGLFYLILALYIYSLNKCEINYMYIGAVGTMLTSGIIFPIITKFKNFKYFIKNIFKCFFSFVSVLVIGGQFPQLMVVLDRFNFLTNSFAGKLIFYDKICQFTNFVAGIFISEPGSYKLLNNHPSYQLIDFKTVSLIGIVLIFCMIISFIINRESKIAKISFLWVLFSTIILLVIGWGTPENGMILYSLYFSWAYLILYFLLIKKIFKTRKIFITTINISILVMVIFNINEFINILRFAIKYY